jgi:hypothetical protein
VALAAFGMAGAAVPLWAEGAGDAQPAAQAEVMRLSEVMQIGGVVEVMRAEGIDYGVTLEAEMFPDAGGEDWQAAVARIYEPKAMRSLFDARLATELADQPQAVAAALTFFDTELGQKILTLELEARRVLMDDDAEEAAKARLEEMRANEDPRFAALEGFAEANDLIEMNVMGALNANLAFYKGLNAEGAFPGGMTEEDMLADVWGQEADVRAETEAWLFPFLALAYGGLTDEELAAYQAFSETPAGVAINAAVFAAFDEVFVDISEKLGREAARQMQGQDI